MDIAFSTLILFIWFIFPSVVYRKFYFQNKFSHEFHREGFGDLVSASIIPSVIIQVGYFFAYRAITQNHFNLHTIISIFYPSGNASIEQGLDYVKEHLSEIAWYHIFLWLSSAILGLLSYGLIRTTKLDRKVPVLRFQNELYYIFSGEIMDYSFTRQSSSWISFTVIDVLVNVHHMSILYSGFLEDFKLTSDGKRLEYIYLSSAIVRRFVDGSHVIESNSAESISGDYLIIPSEKILNLNISYYSAQEAK